MSELALSLIEKEREEKTGKLDLGKCGLTQIPEEVFELEWLEELSLSNRFYDYIKLDWIESSNSGSYNQIKSDLPKAFKNLKKLRILYLNGSSDEDIWKLGDLSPLFNLNSLEVLDLTATTLNKGQNFFNHIEKLQSLIYLNLTFNNLNEVPDAIGQIARLQNLQLLDLRSNQFSTLPEAIAQLQNLQVLDLRSNQFSTLPEAIAQLQNLQVLDLRSNQFSTLPEAIAQLKNLQELDLSGNQFSTLPEAIAQLQNLQQLYLSGNQFSTLPEAIAQLKNLQKLYLSGNQLSTLPEAIAQLQNLQVLDLRSNQFSTLPEAIAQLQNLQVLDLRSNQLSTLPEAIAQLQNLQQLYLSGNQFSTLPEAIAQLQNLQKLYLSGNQFSTLPEAIAQLKNLQKLNLSGNQFSTLPEAIAQLKNLQELTLSENQFSTLPEAIAQLKNLQDLDLRSNQFSTLPEAITQLKNLQELSLSYNQFSTLPEAIAQLKNLQQLDLSGNQFSTLPEAIAQLKNLQQLDLSRNQISNIDILGNLVKIREIDLQKNPIRDVFALLALVKMGMPVRLHIFNFGEGIKLFNCPLINPPLEIAKLGNKAIISYFDSFEGEEGEFLKEIKVLLVGEGMAGKTSLLNKIQGKEFNAEESQTHGINIESLDLENLPAFQQYEEIQGVRTHFWDFGGQEIMHASHQFFLSKRSIYVLVLDSRTDRKKYYWLHHIRKFGGDSPAIVVVNKIDENKNYFLERRELNSKFSFIEGRFHRISCKEGEGISEFIKELAKLIPNTELFQTRISKRWKQVKEQLEAETEAKNYINRKRFLEICEENSVSQEEQQNTLIEFFNALGIVLHFKRLQLTDYYVLDPHWVTIGVYRIVNSFAIEKGILKEDQLDYILNKEVDKKTTYQPSAEKKIQYSSSEQSYIVSIMEEFELLYKFKEQEYLIPDVLLKEPEEEIEFEEEEAIQFILEYDFLPTSIISRFIIRMKEDIKDLNKLWRTGVYLSSDSHQATALVTADMDRREIKILVNGADKQKREYFSVIRHKLWAINNSFKDLDITEWMPIPGYPEERKEYEELLALEKMGEKSFPIGRLKKRFEVSYILDKIASPLERQSDQYRDPRQVSPEDKSGKFVINIENNVMAKSESNNETKFENIGNPKVTQTNNQNVRQENNQTVSQVSIQKVIQYLKNELPTFESEINFLQEELEDESSEEAKEMHGELEKLKKSMAKMQASVDKGDEKEVKTSSFWRRLGKVGNLAFELSKKLFIPETWSNLLKMLYNFDKTAETINVDTGLNFENYGSE